MHGTIIVLDEFDRELPGESGSVDFVVNAMVGVDECDVLLNTTGSYPTLVPFLDTPEPMTTASPYGPNV